MTLTLEFVNGDSVVIRDQDEITRVLRIVDGATTNGKVILRFKADGTVYRANLDAVAYIWGGEYMADKVDKDDLADLLISAFAIIVEEVGFGLSSWPRHRMDKTVEDIKNLIDTRLGVSR